MNTSLIDSSALSKIPPDVTFRFPKSTTWTIPSQRGKGLKKVEQLVTTLKKRKIEDMNDTELPFETPKTEKVSCHLCGKTLINERVLDYHAIHCKGGKLPFETPKNEKVSCHLCGRTLINQGVLDYHVIHCKGGKLPFETPKHEKVSCHRCGRTLINQAILDYHVIHCKGGNRYSMDSLFNGVSKENDKIHGPVIEDISEDGDRGASEIENDLEIEFDGDEIEANKTILAMVSRVFGNMFFVHDTKDKSAAEIVLEDTKKPPFQIMLDAIYDVKPMKESLWGKSVDEIFAVLYLVSKYEIPKLVMAVRECLSSFPITEDNVLEVATDAFEYSTTFEEAAQILLVACAKFIQSKVGDGESFIRFVAESGDQMATVQKLAILMTDMTCVMDAR